jgi:hypothetical protein
MDLLGALLDDKGVDSNLVVDQNPISGNSR